MSDIKAGDLVWLKSGSPAMTVRCINKAGLADLEWYVGNELHTAQHLADSLTTIDPTPPKKSAFLFSCGDGD